MRDFCSKSLPIFLSLFSFLLCSASYANDLAMIKKRVLEHKERVASKRGSASDLPKEGVDLKGLSLAGAATINSPEFRTLIANNDPYYRFISLLFQGYFHLQMAGSMSPEENTINNSILGYLYAQMSLIESTYRQELRKSIHGLPTPGNVRTWLHEEAPLLRGTIAERAGATIAHQRHYSGQGVIINLVELTQRQLYHPALGHGSHQEAATATLHSQPGTLDWTVKTHAAELRWIIEKIAPSATIVERQPDALNRQLQEIVVNPHGLTIFNMSFGPRIDTFYPAEWQWLVNEMATNPAKENFLFIKSLGNNNQLREHEVKIFTPYWNQCIFALWVDPRQVKHAKSNMPKTPEIAARTLSAGPDDGFALSEGGKYNAFEGEGTSGAAAVISGAAALVASKFPHFSAAQVSECLLMSARRTFFASTFDGKFAVMVVDLDDPQDNAYFTQYKALLKSSSTGPVIMTEPFNFQLFGAGLLSVPRSLRYGELLDKYPHKTPAERRSMLHEEEAFQEKIAQKRIAKAFKKYKKAGLKATKQEGESFSSYAALIAQFHIIRVQFSHNPSPHIFYELGAFEKRTAEAKSKLTPLEYAYLQFLTAHVRYIYFPNQINETSLKQQIIQLNSIVPGIHTGDVRAGPKHTPDDIGKGKKPIPGILRLPPGLKIPPQKIPTQNET